MSRAGPSTMTRTALPLDESEHLRDRLSQRLIPAEHARLVMQKGRPADAGGGCVRYTWRGTTVVVAPRCRGAAVAGVTAYRDVSAIADWRDAVSAGDVPASPPAADAAGLKSSALGDAPNTAPWSVLWTIQPRRAVLSAFVAHAGLAS